MKKITRYNGYIIEFIEHRGDYRIYDPRYPAQTIAYEDSIEEAKQGIEEQLEDLTSIEDRVCLKLLKAQE